MRKLFIFLIFSAFIFCFYACGGGSNDAGESDSAEANEDFDKRSMLKSIGEDIIIPSYESFYSSTQDLKSKCQVFINSPSIDTLGHVRNAWLECKHKWELTESFQVGPVKDDSYIFTIDFWPTRPSLIQSSLGEKIEFGVSDFKIVGAAAKGLPAIEYLLYADGDLESVLSSLAKGSQSQAYLLGLCLYLEDQALHLLEEWTDPEIGFLKEFLNPGEIGAYYENEHELISVIINSLIAQVEFAKNKKIGMPFGKSSDSPVLNSAEAYYSETSYDNILANLDGLKVLFDQADASDLINISDYLNTLDAGLTEDIISQIDVCRALVEESDNSLIVDIVDHSDQVERLYQAYDTLLRYLKVDMANSMGITISSSDNDGD